MCEYMIFQIIVGLCEPKELTNNALPGGEPCLQECCRPKVSAS